MNLSENFLNEEFSRRNQNIVQYESQVTEGFIIYVIKTTFIEGQLGT